MMKLIHENPYRIIGVLANSTTKEIQSRKTKIQAFARVGKPITSEYDFPFLQPINRDETRINKAFSAIEQNQDKVTHSLFWFISQNPIDETAIRHLISGNKEKAIEIWEKVTDGKEVGAKNFSAFNNISTIYFLGENEEEIKNGITNKIKLIESESFTDFLHTVADKTFAIASNKQIKLFIDELLVQSKGKYSTAHLIYLFSNCNRTTQKYLSKKFTEEPIHKVESQIEKAKNERLEDQSNAYRIGIDLHNNTKKELDLLKSILGADNLQYKMLADNMTKELTQCSIDYFNAWQDSKDPSVDSLRLLEYAQPFAVNQQTKDRIKKNIKTINEFRERDIQMATVVLKQIQEVYHATHLNNRTSVNEDKVIKLLKEKVTPEIVIKIAQSSDGVFYLAMKLGVLN